MKIKVSILLLALTLITICLCTSVTVVAQTPTPRSVDLTWNDLQNPTGTQYNVYRTAGTNSTITPCSGSPTFAKITSAPISTLAFTDLTVKTNNAYCYYVTSVSGVFESAPSNLATAVVGPFAPTNVIGTPH